jgi:DNA-directed RNA polymerase specialized sigma24 family protein
VSGCAIGTVRSRLHNAKRHLQERLARDGVGLMGREEDKEGTT